jgi:hypothetical protein
MSLHVFMFVFLLVVCHLILLALLWRLDWFALQPSSAPGGDEVGCQRGTVCSSDLPDNYQVVS